MRQKIRTGEWLRMDKMSRQKKEPGLKEQTIGYYNQYAEQFAERTVGADMSFCQNAFLKHLPAHSLILDAGCGSGRDSRIFMEKGYQVCAVDASEEMCRVAAKQIGRPAECMRFEEMTWRERFDGIWACASLLHVSRSELPLVLRNFHRALKIGGVMYASFKYGGGEEERLGRFFNDYRLGELEDVFLREGLFALVESFETEDARPDYKEKPWVNIIVRKICV